MAIASGHTPAGRPTDLISHAQSVATTIPGGTFRGPLIDKFGAAMYKKTIPRMGPAERPPRTSPPALPVPGAWRCANGISRAVPDSPDFGLACGVRDRRSYSALPSSQTLAGEVMSALLEPTTSGTEMTALLSALTALRQGRAGVRLPPDWTGVAGKVADAFNDVVEHERAHDRGIRPPQPRRRQGGQALPSGSRSATSTGSGASKLESVNDLIDDLVHPTIETARVIGAVAQGDLSKTMALDIDDRPLQGEFLRTAQTINTMVDQLGSFASEVTRVAREVGTEGKLGGQAEVKGVAGTWKDLTDSVNGMAANLTAQVRNIAEVTTAVANGDLSRKITVDVKGEFLELQEHHQHDGGSTAARSRRR